MCRRMPAEPALRIVVSTWNVAQTAPPAEGLGEWLGAGAGADIHAVALQEVVELDSALSYCRCCAGGGLSRQAAAWEAAVSAELGSLERVASLQLVGMVLLVYVSPSLAPHVAVEAQMAGTGPLRFGNKGAVAATLFFKGSSLTFLCCHLAAGKKGPHRRNAEFHEVMRRLRLGVLDQQREGGAISTDPALSCRQLLVWCGDLNYRLSLPNEEAQPATHTHRLPPPASRPPPSLPSHTHASLRPPTRLPAPSQPVERLTELACLVPGPIPRRRRPPRRDAAGGRAARLPRGCARLRRLRRGADPLRADVQVRPRHRHSRLVQEAARAAGEVQPRRGGGAHSVAASRRAPAYCDRVLWRDEPNLACEVRGDTGRYGEMFRF
mmetsp:Transcript_37223/g.120214  ORF Transcript_37223/g.120214 Transcript_37223/m.120214 type:complete len:380 (-) Transcript_37223:46-1185(-)